MSLNNLYREEPREGRASRASSGAAFICECLELATQRLEQHSWEVSWSLGKYICSVKGLFLQARDLERLPSGSQPKAEHLQRRKWLVKAVTLQEEWRPVAARGEIAF